MAIAAQSSTSWRLPLLLFLAAFVGVVIYATAHKRSVDEPRGAATRTAEAPSLHSERHVIASSADALNVGSRVNAAAQKPGPPDLVAERTAMDSAQRAADATAALAASILLGFASVESSSGTPLKYYRCGSDLCVIVARQTPNPLITSSEICLRGSHSGCAEV
jgi:hypothetical protein